MKRRFRKGGYTSTQVDGTDEVVGLSELCWKYIQSDTFETLERNRARLKSALQPKDRAYIEETWQPKESRVIYAYTHLYPNLGATSSQRGESYHFVMKQVTNGQLSWTVYTTAELGTLLWKRASGCGISTKAYVDGINSQLARVQGHPAS